MSQSVVGTNDFTEQPKRRKKVRGGGWATIRTWMGPRAKIDEFIDSTVADLDPEDITATESTPAVIEATFMDVDTSQSSQDAFAQAEEEAVWELIWSPLDKTLGTHGAFNIYKPTGGGGTAIHAQERVNQAIKDGTASTIDWANEADIQGIANVQDFSNLLLKGVDTWRTWSPVIRKTMSVGRTINFNIDNPNAQKVVPYNAIGLPSDVKWAQPKMNLYDPVQQIWRWQPFAEWLTSPANIVYRKQKHEITWEWIGAVKWYSILYDCYAGGGAASDADGWN